MSVYVLRLISGEEVVSEAEYKSESQKWALKNPARLVPVRGNNGKEGQEVSLALVPLIPPYCTGKEIEISAPAIVYILPPNADLLNEYNRVYGSGIIIPHPGTIKVNKEQLLKG